MTTLLNVAVTVCYLYNEVNSQILSVCSFDRTVVVMIWKVLPVAVLSNVLVVFLFCLCLLDISVDKGLLSLD